MAILDKLTTWLRHLLAFDSDPQEGDYRTLYIKCGKCGEVFKVGYHLGTDVSWGETESAPGQTGVLHKEAMDSSCFQKIQIELGFDARKEVVSRDIVGGEFVEAPPEQGG